MLYTFESCMHRSNELQSLEVFSLLLRSVPVFLVGRFMPFKSAHWTFLIDVLIMQKEKCCKTCKKHDDFTWVCFNGDSEHCADFTEPDCVCEFWEDVENENS